MTTRLRWIALALALLIGGLSVLVAQSDPPKLTDSQKLLLENRILAVQLAQARLDAIIKEYSVAGYDLTAAGEYVKKADPPKAVTP